MGEAVSKRTFAAAFAVVALSLAGVAVATGSASATQSNWRVLRQCKSEDVQVEALVNNVWAKTVTNVSHSPLSPTVASPSDTAAVTFTADTKPLISTDTTDLNGNADSRWSFRVFDIHGLVPGGSVNASSNRSLTVNLKPGSYVALGIFDGGVTTTTLGPKDEVIKTHYGPSCGRDEVTVLVKVVVTTTATETQTATATVTEPGTPGPTVTVFPVPSVDQGGTNKPRTIG